MALKLSITDSDIGVAFPDAYARIVAVQANKHQASYTVEVHASQVARESRKQAIRTDTFTAQMDEVSGDIYPALYTHLKQQEFYSTGVDV
jgi:hypothetical protein